jgi:hypothetical protein
VSLAMVAIAHGCKCHVVLPDDAAIEKVSLASGVLHPGSFKSLCDFSGQRD